MSCNFSWNKCYTIDNPSPKLWGELRYERKTRILYGWMMVSSFVEMFYIFQINILLSEKVRNDLTFLVLLKINLSYKSRMVTIIIHQIWCQHWFLWSILIPINIIH